MSDNTEKKYSEEDIRLLMKKIREEEKKEEKAGNAKRFFSGLLEKAQTSISNSVDSVLEAGDTRIERNRTEEEIQKEIARLTEELAKKRGIKL